MMELNLARQGLNQTGYADSRRKAERIERAHHLYEVTTLKGQVGWVWGKLSGRSQALLDLKMVPYDCLAGGHSAGTQVVPVEQIRGSVNRTHDFDQNFNPLQAHTKERWINLAVTWLAGVTLPPVQLIQVGDVYFVEDGHHRVSVARALGQRYIDAEVMVWQVGPEQRCALPPRFCGAMC